MKIMQEKEWKAIYHSHQKWLKDNRTGNRMRIEGYDLTDIKFTLTPRLTGACLPRCVFKGSDLAGVDLSHSNLSYSDLSLSRLTLANFSWAVMPGANLKTSMGSRVNFYGTLLKHSDFSDCYLKDPNFTRANLSYSYFADAWLPGGDFNGANFCNALLWHTKFYHSRFRMAADFFRNISIAWNGGHPTTPFSTRALTSGL